MSQYKVSRYKVPKDLVDSTLTPKQKKYLEAYYYDHCKKEISEFLMLKELVKYLPKNARQDFELEITDSRLEEVLNQHEDKINELSGLISSYDKKTSDYANLKPITEKAFKLPMKNKDTIKFGFNGSLFDMISYASLAALCSYGVCSLIEAMELMYALPSAIFIGFLVLSVNVGGLSVNPLRLPIAGIIAAKRGIQKANHWRLKYKIKNQKEKLAKTIAKDYANNNLIWEAIEAYKNRSDLTSILNQLNKQDKEITVSYIGERAEREINTASVEEILEIRNILIKNDIRNSEVDKAYAKKLMYEIPDRFKKQDSTLRSLIDELKDNPKRHDNLISLLKLEIRKGFHDLKNISLAEQYKVGEYFSYCESIGFNEECDKHRKEFGELFVDGLKRFCPRGPKIEEKYLKQEEHVSLPPGLTLEEWIGKRRFLSREDIRTAGRETSPDGCYITLQHGFELLLNKADELPEQEMPYLHEYIESVVIPEIELGLKKHDGIFSKKYSRKILITYMDQFRELARQTKIFKLESEPAMPYTPKKETIEELLPEPPKTKTKKPEQAEEEGAILQ